MKWDRNYSSSEVDDRRDEVGPSGGGGGGGLWTLFRVFSAFGWKGTLVGIVIVGAIAVGSQFTGSHRTPSSQSHRPVASSPQEDELKHFVGFVFDDIQKSWERQMPGYQHARLELFRRAIRSACGTATSAVGPFYCQLDHRVYIDLGFYDDLRRRFGAPGDFAQAYVIAHEVGHHVQNLRGLLGKHEADSVHVELQADCLAGAWAKDADQRGLVEGGDIEEALNAAAQIGDDTLQKKQQGYVQPEKFTHGTSAQRSASFRRGYEQGPTGCL